MTFAVDLLDDAERLAVTGARRAGVGERIRSTAGPQVAERREQAQELVAVALVELPVERLRVDRLGQQLGDVAARVVRHVTVGLGGAPERPVGLVEVRGRLHDVRLQRDAELPAVVQDPAMVVGQASGAHVDVQALVDRGSLMGDAVLLGVLGDERPAPGGEAAPAGARLRLEDPALVARPAELVRRGEPSDAGAEDEHRLAGAGSAGELRRPGPGVGHSDEPQRGHRLVQRGGTAGRADLLQEVAPRPVALCLVGHRELPRSRARGRPHRPRFPKPPGEPR